MITTQTATRREGGGYILRRGYYPQSGFFRKSVHENDLERQPLSRNTKKQDPEEAPCELVWSDNLREDIAQARREENIYLAQQAIKADRSRAVA